MREVAIRYLVQNVVERSVRALPTVQLEHVQSGSAMLTGPLSVSEPHGEIVFKPGDVIFGKLRPYLSKSLLVEQELHGSGEFLCLRPGECLDSRYLKYVTLSRPWLDQAALTSYGSKMPRTSWEQMASFPLPEMPLQDQRRIATFLDDRLGRIDRIVSARRRQADLLERVTASRLEEIVLGHHRLDQGSRPAEWLPFGRIPERWREGRLRSLKAFVQTGPFGSQLHSEEYVPAGWPVVNPASLIGGRLRAVAGMSVDQETRDRLSRHVLREGDIVFGRRGEMGRAGLVTRDEVGWLCGTGSLLVRLSDPLMRPEYLVALLRTAAVRHYFTLTSVGSTMDNLNTGILLGVPLLIPSVEEQTRLLIDVDRVDAGLGEHRKGLEASIALLDEYRQSLITAAVAGDLDVTTAGSGILG